MGHDFSGTTSPLHVNGPQYKALPKGVGGGGGGGEGTWFLAFHFVLTKGVI